MSGSQTKETQGGKYEAQSPEGGTLQKLRVTRVDKLCHLEFHTHWFSHQVSSKASRGSLMREKDEWGLLVSPT